eukprot:5528551-Pyramimonas_sp.AAC.1
MSVRMRAARFWSYEGVDVGDASDSDLGLVDDEGLGEPLAEGGLVGDVEVDDGPPEPPGVVKVSLPGGAIRYYPPTETQKARFEATCSRDHYIKGKERPCRITRYFIDP